MALDRRYRRPDERGGKYLAKRICVIDGQGGGIGSSLIKYLREARGESVEIIALGTNAIAVTQMLKAGANRGASGENAICRTVGQVDGILGPISITWANAMLGEVTPKMAESIMSSPAIKILIPLSQENAQIVGVAKEPLPHLVQSAVVQFEEVWKHV
jgi:NAD(P)-dependent dehydrogenase (short-subunit alcohol dehydrogenase family)